MNKLLPIKGNEASRHRIDVASELYNPDIKITGITGAKMCVGCLR